MLGSRSSRPMTRRQAFAGLSAAPVTAALVLAGFSRPRHAFAAATTGKTPPALQARALDGKAVDLAAWRGEVVLVDFWATWCEPCKLSLPQYAALQRKHAAAGLRIVAVSVDEDASKLRRFIDRHKVALTVVHDAGSKIAARWEPARMPTAYLIGRDGQIAWVHGGFAPGDETKVDAQIRRALVGKALSPKEPK